MGHAADYGRQKWANSECGCPQEYGGLTPVFTGTKEAADRGGLSFRTPYLGRRRELDPIFGQP
jgi:hypothetical protein